MKTIEKRFPATTSMDITTFLNDKKIDGELYALFQSYSIPDEQHRTIVKKGSLPTQQAMCEMLGIKQPKTLRDHRNYLIAQGYIIEESDQYILPNKEDIYFMIPLNTLLFLNDTLKEFVIKMYIYLGQRWKYKGSAYIFTLEELGQHLGRPTKNDKRAGTAISNALLCLQRLGLIDYEDIYQRDAKTGRSVPRKRLTSFAFSISKG